jgi:hypothetical protein
MSVRNHFIERLEQDLLGPLRVNEVLQSYPTDTYLTGILFPRRSEVAKEERDQQNTEGGGSADGTEGGQEEVSLVHVKRPASAGLSFAVAAQGTPEIEVLLSAATYERKEKEGEAGIFEWQRISAAPPPLQVRLDFTSRDFHGPVTGVPGLGLHIRTSSWGEKLLVTVAMLNEHLLPEPYERASYETLCFFQTQLVVRVAEGTHFCSRPLGSSASDDDTRASRLIYRNVVEYAVGHTCSADWDGEGGPRSTVHTVWLPRRSVATMSSEGVADFKSLSESSSGPVLNTQWLSETSGAALRAGLMRLPQLYGGWLNGEESRIESDVEPGLHTQAKKHIDHARNVQRRMERAVKAMEDENVETAFRLANRAIMLQRKWSTPEEPAMKWHPFQLGFFLLCLSSLVDENDPDRDVADLLWFPTGGGKTEAYLGLIAFVLFLRRLRETDHGAGVGCFMRYTLRLLTVQQFQRAAALICACDTLRHGEELPKGLKPKLGDIPFSLGLWVGGDATPNNFEDAREALANANAPNRPDQLTFCPRHRTEKLIWTANDKSKEVEVRCANNKCLWKTQLPIWTVDTSIYTRTPSLVIGTIDKFAQLARKEQTRSLFGRGSIPRRRPDLIIQDELHLISGPLGTLAGLYEAAIDRLCSEGDARPKIIASTATIREASAQILALFNRGTCLFPPPVLDASNSGFAIEDASRPGRCYLGVTTAGRSAKFALQAVAASLLQAAKADSLTDQQRDDFWTLVTYFNSLRELGSSLVLMQQDVFASLENYARRQGEEPRKIQEPMELTSRVSSSEIKEYLDLLARKQGQDGCCDVVLASNMISVGVDVPRLGAMIVTGQPKTVAEYIQATSRVGRRAGGPGGLVVTVYVAAKARDRSHYESFRTGHMALYREVEATSVTPFAPRARDKALHAPLVILARHLIDAIASSPAQADGFQDEIEEFLDYICQRAEKIDPGEAANVERDLRAFFDEWVYSSSALKAYWNDRAPFRSLLISAETAAAKRARYGAYTGRARPTPNSMRNVEASALFKLEEELR